MKKCQLVTILVLLFLVAGMGQSQEVASLSGHATLTTDGSPAPNLALKLTKADQPYKDQFAIVVTNADGYFLFHKFTFMNRKLITGKYTLTNIDTTLYDPITFSNVELIAGENVLDFTTNRRGGNATIAGQVSLNNQGKADVDLYFYRVYSIGSSLQKGNQDPPRDLNDATYSIKTDQNGDFSLEVVAGQYFVFIPGTDEYLPYWSHNVSVGPEQTTTIQIELKVNDSLTISGTVTNFESLDQVYVTAYSVNSRGGSAFTILDQTGKYTLYVNSGEFIISCVGFKDGNLVSLFYHKDKGQVSSPEEATIVNLTESMANVDFTFSSLNSSTVTIKGIVTDENTGFPLEGADVGFLSANANSIGQSQNGNIHRNFRLKTVKTGNDGSYTWESSTLLDEISLLGYSYKKDYFIEFFDNQPTFFTASMIVAKANVPVTGIDFSLSPINTQTTFSISGTVMGDDGNPVTYGSVLAYSTYGKKYVPVNEDGSYKMEGFPEGTNVILQAWGFPNYIPEFYNNQYSIISADVLEMNENKTGINFELAKRNYDNAVGKIGGGIVGNGNLSKSNLNGDLSGVTLYIKPSGDTEWYSANYSDVNGQYELPIEGYGQYEILVTAPGFDDYTEIVEMNSSLFKNDLNINLISTDVEDDLENVVRKYKLYEAYPNPFNPTTTINVDIASPGDMTLIIYNVLGQKERTIYSGLIQPGSHCFVWDGKDELGETLSSGLYFYQFNISNIQETKAVVFMK